MGYMAARGGEKAIENAKNVLESFRQENRLAVDQVMGEGSLYSKDLARIAVRQAEGDLIEASFLVRAYRSTLARIGHSEPIDTREMQVIRRISSAFRDIPGGQILGPTRDYTQRLLEFEPSSENQGRLGDRVTEDPPCLEKVSDDLKRKGLLSMPKAVDAEPFDITRDALEFPLPRSARLQALSRGESGAMMALAYSSLRGYGSVHPTVAELRVGYVNIRIKHPHTGKSVCLGKILVTECEGILSSSIGSVHLDEQSRFSLGYGLVFGQNERKAISMAILDGTTSSDHPKAPAEDQEFVFYHIDGVDAMGFVEHLKLPHYVTFQSSLDIAIKARKEEDVRL
jgi:alpha-D-ribose 1-methylphosphonate 5-triphosphate synthase subunit PhnI